MMSAFFKAFPMKLIFFKQEGKRKNKCEPKELAYKLSTKMATHSSILAWRIPWREEPGRLQSMGLQRVGHNSATSLITNIMKKQRHFFMI